MAEPKTKPSKTSVAGFVAKQPENIRADTQALIDMMEELSGAPPCFVGEQHYWFRPIHLRLRKRQVRRLANHRPQPKKEKPGGLFDVRL